MGKSAWHFSVFRMVFAGGGIVGCRCCRSCNTGDGSGRITLKAKAKAKRLLCVLLGHKLRFERAALEGGKIFQCERCGQAWWLTPDGWHDLGGD